MEPQLDDRLRAHWDLVVFQLNVAGRWMRAARDLPSTTPPQFEFVANFAALNALYWLWGVVHDEQAFSANDRRSIEAALGGLPEALRKRVVDRLRGLPGEHKLISNLVAALAPERVASILEDHEVQEGIDYLQRRGPVQRMDRRELDGVSGDEEEGKKFSKRLRDGEAVERLNALAQILYLVRCNLVHGSKIINGLDVELLRHSNPPLRRITEACEEMIRKACP